jgi:hypothetical protein
MSSTTCEKLVKYTIKSISKKYSLEYDEVKESLRKVVKTARSYDESLLGMMEEMMDLGNVGSPEELEDFNIEVLKIYCKIKDLDSDGSDRHIRSRVWKNIESEFELDDEDESEDESVVDSDDDESDEEVEIKELPLPPPVEKKKKKSSSSKSE